MAESTKNPVPPYTTYKSFINLINDLRETGIPRHVTRSVVKGSNSGKAMMSTALKSLGLINDDTTPTEELRKLVNAGDRHGEVLAEIIRASYPFLFDGSIDLANTTTDKMTEKFKDAGAGGSTVTKCVAFFLAAANEAGIAISRRVNAPVIVRNGSSSRPKPRKAAPPPLGDPALGRQPSGEAPKGMVMIPIPLHGMPDGAILLPENLTKQQWTYAKKMAQFILENYHEVFDSQEDALV